MCHLSTARGVWCYKVWVFGYKLFVQRNQTAAWRHKIEKLYEKLIFLFSKIYIDVFMYRFWVINVTVEEWGSRSGDAIAIFLGSSGAIKHKS